MVYSSMNTTTSHTRAEGVAVIIEAGVEYSYQLIKGWPRFRYGRRSSTGHYSTNVISVAAEAHFDRLLNHWNRLGQMGEVRWHYWRDH